MLNTTAHLHEPITRNVGGNTTRQRSEDPREFPLRARARLLLVAEITIPNEDLIGNYEEPALLICRNVSENKFAYILRRL